jgi:hypothetical protein
MEASTVLLTPAQHQLVLLNVRVNLTWKNLGGVFVGPYVTLEDFKTFIENKA